MGQATCYLYLIIMALLPLLLFKLKKQPAGHGARLPPGPWRLPVIGSFHHLLGKPHIHHALADLARRLDAPLMYLKLGNFPVVVATSADAARGVMKANGGAAFASRPWSPTINTMTADGEGLTFAPYGDLWRRLRRVTVLELLSARRVESFHRVREEVAAGLVAAVAAALPDELVNVSEHICSLVTSSVVRAMVGDGFERQGEFLKMLKERLDAADGSGFSHGDLFPSSWFVDFVSGTTRRARENHRKNSELMDWAIEKHKERKRGEMEEKERVVEESIVDVLLRIQKDGGSLDDVPLSMGTVKALIIDLFVGGSGTTMTSIQWAMSELMRNPNVMAKAQAELRSVLKGKPKVSEDDLVQMKYLKVIVKETLRLHPPGPLLLPRESRASCKILGYDVPKGTTVLVNAWAIGRDPKYWEGAEVFRPERFESSTIEFKGTDFEFIPFGAGRRICPGMTFALRNIELTLAALLYHFDWKLPNSLKPSDLDMTEEMGLTIRRKNDLYLHAIICVPFQSAN
ncbi:unnamed protein product [Urochloa decumbens]|uniref:Cytochrome P450 71D7 n=1 Tax=Urochloa decumbens TaxID=240449 RepID=A0ABC9B6W7_9POAL